MKKFSILSLFVVIVGILVCVSSAYLLSTAILSANIFQNNSSASFDKQIVYAISMDKSETKESLSDKIKELQSQNGAGYIYESENFFYVIASLYENQNDAEKVKSNLETSGVSAEILKIELSEIKIKGNFSAERKEILNKCLRADFDTFKVLYDVAISLDTNVFDKTKAKLQCNNIFSNHISTKTNFQTFFKEDLNNETFKKINENLLSTENILSNLISEVFQNPNQTFSSLIKLSYCQILLK